MLSTTFSVITLSTEHRKFRDRASKLLQRVQACLSETCIDQYEFKSLLNELGQFNDAYHDRTLEQYVIPALRISTRTADVLIAQLDMLSEAGEFLLRSLSRQLSGVQYLGRADDPEMRKVMETYCKQMLKRLELEEKELLPLTMNVLSKDEDWFSIATQLLKKIDLNHQHHAVGNAHHPHSRSGMPSLVKN